MLRTTRVAHSAGKSVESRQRSICAVVTRSVFLSSLFTSSPHASQASKRKRRRAAIDGRTPIDYTDCVARPPSAVIVERLICQSARVGLSHSTRRTHGTQSTSDAGDGPLGLPYVAKSLRVVKCQPERRELTKIYSLCFQLNFSYSLSFFSPFKEVRRYFFTLNTEDLTFL